MLDEYDIERCLLEIDKRRAIEQTKNTVEYAIKTKRKLGMQGIETNMNEDSNTLRDLLQTSLDKSIVTRQDVLNAEDEGNAAKVLLLTRSEDKVAASMAKVTLRRMRGSKFKRSSGSSERNGGMPPS